MPSQRVNNKPYDVWSVVKKDKIQEPGGEIFSAYCTCTAGLSSTCNHIVGMLFRVEAAVTTGQTNPSKTSVLSSWNIPRGSKVNTKSKPLRDIVFHKSHYTKPQNSFQEREKAQGNNFLNSLQHLSQKKKHYKIRKKLEQIYSHF